MCWDAPDGAEGFKSKAFINCHEYVSIDEVVERIGELDRHAAAYAAEVADIDGRCEEVAVFP
jgi:hypothetical protein